MAAGTIPRPRDRMVGAAAELIRRQGVAATGMREIVARARAPRGSLQHYFPGGKDQLVAEAIARSARVVVGGMERWADQHPDASPGDVLAFLAGWWRDLYQARGFDEGCPFAATATDATATTPTVRDAVRDAFDIWQSAVERELTRTGVTADRASSLAVVVMCAVEGAILLARARRDTDPLDAVITEVRPILDAAGETRSASRR